MADIATYPLDAAPTPNDYVIGNAAAGPTTSRFTFDAILALLGAGGTELSRSVQTQTNAGTAGGTMYYINLGGIKLLWLITSNVAAAPNSTQAFTVTLPTSFFNTITFVTEQIVVASGSATGNNVVGDTVTTSTITFYMNNGTGAGGVGGTVGVFVIGT